MRLPQPPLLLITDRRQARRPLEAVVAAALRGGCRWISLREKDLPFDERCALLRRLVGLGAECAATVTVHEDLDAARIAGTAGIHLPSGSSPAAARDLLGPDALIGVSIHSPSELAAAGGASYVSLSPIFPSVSKPGYGPLVGLDGLREAAVRTTIPVVALGGVTAATIGACFSHGAAGVAVMGAVMAAADPEQAVRELLAAGGLD